jgi:hypothetical protein
LTIAGHLCRIPKIEGYLRSGKTYIVAAAVAAHMGGANGVLALVRQRGYRIEQLYSPLPHLSSRDITDSDHLRAFPRMASTISPNTATSWSCSKTTTCHRESRRR